MAAVHARAACAARAAPAQSGPGPTALTVPAGACARARQAGPGAGLRARAPGSLPRHRALARAHGPQRAGTLAQALPPLAPGRQPLLCRALQDESNGAPPARRREVGLGCRIVGTGSATPATVVSNEFLSRIVDTSDEWIASRTGIRQRRVLSEDESLTQLSVDACRRALDMAGVRPGEVDLLIMCTSSPDDIFGGACLVQRELGCTRAVSFDLTAACSGFVLGLVTASRFIQGGGFRNVLVVGADALSRYVDWSDRNTCILFGDGAGAALIQAAAPGEKSSLLGFDMGSDGQGSRHLHARVTSCSAPSPSPSSNGLAVAAAAAAAAAAAPQAGAGAAEAEAGAQHAAAAAAVAVADKETHTAPGAGVEQQEGEVALPGRAQPQFIAMNGREVYKFAVSVVPKVLRNAMEEAEVQVEDLDWLVLHQANQRILDAVALKLGVPGERVLSNVGSYGNTSAASIPLALDEAVRAGRVREGHLLALAGFGAGLTWAGAVVRFG